MEFIVCEQCKSGIPSDKNIRRWKCAPCCSGRNPCELQCVACGLSDGVFQAAEDSWVHFFCAQLLNQHVLYKALPRTLQEALRSVLVVSFPAELFSKCWICKETNKTPTISCGLCFEDVHIKCVLDRNWHINDRVLICGCQKLKVLPAIRPTTSVNRAKQLFKAIAKLD